MNDLEPQDNFNTLVERLSRASVAKHFDAYDDVAWDHEGSRIDPDDPRWERRLDDPLGETEWYWRQPQSTRARIGLHIVACQMKMGIEFENILSRGLLEFAATCPNRSSEFRYAYHEVIEEGQHSLMFQEFVNRSGFDAPGITGHMKWFARRVPPLGRAFPELFFIHVLAGEVPIDHVQRGELKRGNQVHPLLRRILQIHITEEARHVCFARRYLENYVPRLSKLRLAQLRILTPFVLRETTRLMLRPPKALAQEYGIPKSVMAEAYGGDRYRALACDGLAPLRETCASLGIVTPDTAPLWRALGVWPLATPVNALSSGASRLLAK